MKGVESLDFFQWLHDCNIDTKQILEESKKQPWKWIGFEYEVNDDRVSAFPMKVEFKTLFQDNNQTLLVKDSSIVEKTSQGERPAEKVTIKTAADGTRKIEMRTEISAHPFKKYPRNMVCYCGSEKKFKKCHGLVLPDYCHAPEEAGLKKLMDWFLSQSKSMNEGDYSEFCRNYFARQAQPTEAARP